MPGNRDALERNIEESLAAFDARSRGRMQITIGIYTVIAIAFSGASFFIINFVNERFEKFENLRDELELLDEQMIQLREENYYLLKENQEAFKKNEEIGQGIKALNDQISEQKLRTTEILEELNRSNKERDQIDRDFIDELSKTISISNRENFNHFIDSLEREAIENAKRLEGLLDNQIKPRVLENEKRLNEIQHFYERRNKEPFSDLFVVKDDIGKWTRLREVGFYIRIDEAEREYVTNLKVARTPQGDQEQLIKRLDVGNTQLIHFSHGSFRLSLKWVIYMPGWMKSDYAAIHIEAVASP